MPYPGLARMLSTFEMEVTLEKNADYTILHSVLFDNGRGFALGENPAAPSPFVTWQFTEEQGKRDYYWGHYHGDGAAAEKEFAARVADYQQRYGVREVPRPIAEQMKEAGARVEEKPVDKVREHPPQHRSREREER